MNNTNKMEVHNKVEEKARKEVKKDEPPKKEKITWQNFKICGIMYKINNYLKNVHNKSNLENKLNKNK